MSTEPPPPLIAPETHKIFTTHNKKLSNLGQSPYNLAPVRALCPAEHNRVFSYLGRYKLKEADPSKKRFCEDVALSKEYENLLRDYAHLLIHDVEVYFVADGDSVRDAQRQ